MAFECHSRRAAAGRRGRGGRCSNRESREDLEEIRLGKVTILATATAPAACNFTSSVKSPLGLPLGQSSSRFFSTTLTSFADLSRSAWNRPHPWVVRNRKSQRGEMGRCVRDHHLFVGHFHGEAVDYGHGEPLPVGVGFQDS